MLETNGIDRVDNAGSYSPTNTRPACWTCNRMKGVMSEAGFFAHIRDLYQNLSAKGLL